MSRRSITAIIFAIIVFIEVIVFVTTDDPLKFTDTGKRGLFSRYESSVDRDQQKQQNIEFAVLIIATIGVGAIITYSLPNDKFEKKPPTFTNFKTKD